MTNVASLLLEAVIEAARAAGQVALSHFRGDIDVDLKADGSPVTVADRRAEAAAREWIRTRFPHDEILGEEFGYTPGTGRRWFIDPIDGTKTFVRGAPLWGSMIGVAEGDTVLAGAIYCAAVDELVAASLGEGCWLNGTRCRVSTVATLAEATILTTDASFRYHPEREPRWADLARHVAVARTWGDCYGYLMVASGRAEVMVDDKLNPWDAAALIPILREAGGEYTDWRGGIAVDGGDGIATNAALARTVRDRLTRQGRA
jgi:histidinol phosphatase-like enzyme (inositol monophosphatase family)